MKKIYLSAIALFATTLVSAQTFWTYTPYKGAFPVTDGLTGINSNDWTGGWANWDPENTNYGTPTTIVSSNITTNTTWSGIVQIVNNVAVTNNAVLTIQPGTVIRGDKATKSCLIITTGAKIMAQGTAASPIVFTSNEPIASGRANGDWGGLIILGKGLVNTACATCATSPNTNYVEGFTSTFPEILYGGNNNADNSGILSYVRIEFAGVALSATPNSEINGLTMAGVGSGTQIDHIQVSFSGDDSFEWFGGAVDGKYLISFRGLDDDFDTDFGHQGRVQFGLIIKDKDISDAAGDSNGFESDNFNPGIGRLPLTKTIFSNITCIGPKRDGSVALPAGEKFERAIFTRRNTAISIYNSLFTGWEKGWELNGSTTADNYLSTPDSAVVQSIVLTADMNINLLGQAPATMQSYATSHSIDTVMTAAQISFVNGYPAALETTPDYRLSNSSPVASGSSFTNTIFGNTFTGIRNVTTFTNKMVTVYPNPAADKATLVIDALNEASLNISIVDINGRLVSTPVMNQNLSVGENVFTISTDNLNNGVYFVTLNSDNGKETVKLIVNK